MTVLEWVGYIAFCILINLFFQVLAWKIGEYLAKKEEVKDD